MEETQYDEIYKKYTRELELVLPLLTTEQQVYIDDVSVRARGALCFVLVQSNPAFKAWASLACRNLRQGGCAGASLRQFVCSYWSVCRRQCSVATMEAAFSLPLFRLFSYPERIETAFYRLGKVLVICDGML